MKTSHSKAGAWIGTHNLNRTYLCTEQKDCVLHDLLWLPKKKNNNS